MINIVCLKFGTKYDADYVNKLYRAVVRNTTVDFSFHCFTEDPNGLDENIIPHDLPHNLPGVGWWHKLYMFEADKEIGGTIFYIDLDTLITGNIDEMLQYDGDFVVLHDFYRILRPNDRDQFGLGREAVGSGLMMWKAGNYSHIWSTFIKDPVGAVQSLHPHGDQKWIEKQTQHKDRKYFQDLFKNQVVSYKVHCRNGLPPNARIVCYHGAPSIPESITNTTRVQGMVLNPAPWVKDHWK